MVRASHDPGALARSIKSEATTTALTEKVDSLFDQLQHDLAELRTALNDERLLRPKETPQ